MRKYRKLRRPPPVSERHKAFLAGAPTGLITQNLRGDLSLILKTVLDARPSCLRDELLLLVVEAEASADVLCHRLEAARKSA